MRHRRAQQSRDLQWKRALPARRAHLWIVALSGPILGALWSWLVVAGLIWPMIGVAAAGLVVSRVATLLDGPARERVASRWGFFSALMEWIVYFFPLAYAFLSLGFDEPWPMLATALCLFVFLACLAAALQFRSPSVPRPARASTSGLVYWSALLVEEGLVVALFMLMQEMLIDVISAGGGWVEFLTPLFIAGVCAAAFCRPFVVWRQAAMGEPDTFLADWLALMAAFVGFTLVHPGFAVLSL